MNRHFQTLIIGAGPCGMGCALALKKAGINVAMIEKGPVGGKVNIAPRVDNYPKQFQIPGPDLAYIFYQRLMDAEVEIIGDEVLHLNKENNVFVIECASETYTADTVLIASGTKERKLGLAKEEEFLGKGISYCAVCDGHFFKGVDVVIVGGGNSALKEAIHLSHIAKKVYIVHRRNEFRGNEKLIDELKEIPHVEILTPFVPLEIIGETQVEGLRIKDVETNEEKTLEVQGFFPLVGQIPNTHFIDLDVLDEWKTVPVNLKTMETKTPGLFAGGDVLPRQIRQIFLAEHDGMVAANSIIAYLNK
jgi:thioredoxin reductase (NADPH)